MIVYIEYAIIDNLIMDFLLLRATSRLTKTKEIIYLEIIGALIGCTVAVIIPIFNISDGLGFLIKIILAAAICMVSAKHKTVFSYFKYLNVFILLTFAIGGAVIGVLSLMGIDYGVDTIKSKGVLPIGVNFAVAYCLYLLIKKITENCLNKLKRNFVCDCTVSSNGQKFYLRAFVDSGNILIDAKTGLSVIVCNREVINKIYNGIAPKRFMPITTASGLGELGLYEIDGICIKTDKGERRCDAMLGASKDKTRIINDADLIIGAALL